MSEWNQYNECGYNSLEPVDVILDGETFVGNNIVCDNDNIIENVILFQDAIYQPEPNVNEQRGLLTIQLTRITDIKYNHVTHYRKRE